MKLYRCLLPFLLLILPEITLAQKNKPINWWQQTSPFDPRISLSGRWSGLDHYDALWVDFEQYKAALSEAPSEQDILAGKKGLPFTLPLPDGQMARFYVWKVPVLHPDLETKYPEIRTFAGKGIDNPHLILRLDYTMAGLHAMVMGGKGSTAYIDPLQRGNTRDYVCYWKKTLKSTQAHKVECGVSDAEMEASQLNFEQQVHNRASDCGQLRTYRLALAGTGEYTLYHGGGPGNKGPALAAMTTSMNRINGIYERDLSVRMNIIPNNENIIYTDPATDPYDNFSTQAMLDENQTTCDNVIGTTNYDIGHVFGSSNGGGAGVAFLQSVCNASNKAKGVSCADVPEGDFFDVRLVSHEFGHQYGASHMQYNSCFRWDPTAMEPGSASTIMGYAGICPPNIQNDADDYYHTGSLVPMGAFLTGAGDGCATKSGNGNTAPAVNNLSNRTIPRSTPFFLKATASDPNGDALTYCWEQVDAFTGNQQPMPPVSTNVSGPMFRSFLPTASDTRYFPLFEDVLSGFNYDWEELPSVARTMEFRVTARDNRVGGGCTTEKSVTITTDGGSGPFVVTKPNTQIVIQSGAVDTVKWNVANTNNAPVSCANVDILISTDGGLNFSMLLANTPNDGIQTLTFPNVTTNQARIMVRAVGNIFYDVSNVNFYLGNYSSQCNQVFNSTDVPKALNFRGETISTLDISFFAFVQDVNVKNLNITHNQISELGIWLVNPIGVERQLLDQICSGSANMSLNFDDEANNGYGSIPCPPISANAFKSLQTLSDYDNEEINGTWTLRIKDYDSPEAGTLNSWGLEFCFLALPVELQSFKAKKTSEKTARLDWKTITESKNKGFHIERSIGNTSRFETIGWVSGNGDSREPKTYTFEDKALLPNTQHYYRLKQEDMDGAYQYSNVEIISTGAASGLLQISPNPAQNALQLLVPAEKQPEALFVSLWNAAGQLVREQNLNTGQLLLIGDLPTGVYRIRATSASESWTGTVVKQ